MIKFIVSLLSFCMTSTAICAIEITESNFPDANFRSYLLNQSYGMDGELTAYEIAKITKLDIRSKNIQNLKGIRCFTSLEELYCSYNKLTSLDVSKITTLTYLDCQCNQLTSLDVSGCRELTYLDCRLNQITSLDVSNSTLLSNLICYDNQLVTLDISNNKELTCLDCPNNKLTTLNVSGLEFLKGLYCEDNQLTSLDVSGCTAMEWISCFNNQLTSLNVSGCLSLYKIKCNLNNIKGSAMDELVQSLPNISSGTMNIIDYTNEQNVMTKAQVAIAKEKGWEPLYNTGVEWKNYFGSIPDEPIVEDVAINEENFPDTNFRNWILSQDYGGDGIITDKEIAGVTRIDVSYKDIHNLKGIEYFNHLKYLACHCNQLTSLDVSQNTGLTTLYCYSNQLTSLDVSNNTALNEFMCGSNQLTSLDLSNNILLTNLSCTYTQLTSLDVSKQTELVSLYCNNNQLISLNIPNSASLTRIYCYNNQIKDKEMDELIDYLKTNSNGIIRVVSNSNEGNEMTTKQVATVKAKGWTPYYYNDGEWQEYAGSAPKKCATPSIAFENGELTFSCETEDVEYIYDITSSMSGEGANVTLPTKTKYRVTVYATKDGYEKSDVATEEIEVSSGGIKGDVNEDDKVNGTDIQEVINIIVNAD